MPDLEEDEETLLDEYIQIWRNWEPTKRFTFVKLSRLRQRSALGGEAFQTAVNQLVAKNILQLRGLIETGEDTPDQAVQFTRQGWEWAESEGLVSVEDLE